MVKKRAGVFIGFEKTRRSLVILDPMKQVLWAFWTVSKIFLGKRVSTELITIMLCERWKLAYEKNIELVWKKNQIVNVFWTFLLLTGENMVSYSKAFRKPKNAEYERNFI